MPIRIPSRELFRRSRRAIDSGRLPRRRRHGDASRAPTRSIRVWVAAWNSLSRAHALGGGLVHLLRGGGVPRARRLQPGALRRARRSTSSRRLKRLARRERRAIVILHRHPLRTSDRKARLYTKREHFAFMLKTLLARRAQPAQPRELLRLVRRPALAASAARLRSSRTTAHQAGDVLLARLRMASVSLVCGSSLPGTSTATLRQRVPRKVPLGWMRPPTFSWTYSTGLPLQ